MLLVGSYVARDWTSGEWRERKEGKREEIEKERGNTERERGKKRQRERQRVCVVNSYLVNGGLHKRCKPLANLFLPRQNKW